MCVSQSDTHVSTQISHCVETLNPLNWISICPCLLSTFSLSHVLFLFLTYVNLGHSNQSPFNFSHLKVLNNWILKGSSNDEHLAIDPLGILNPSCSVLKNGKLRSLNLDLRPDLIRRQNLNLSGPKSAPVIQV